MSGCAWIDEVSKRVDLRAPVRVPVSGVGIRCDQAGGRQPEGGVMADPHRDFGVDQDRKNIQHGRYANWWRIARFKPVRRSPSGPPSELGHRLTGRSRAGTRRGGAQPQRLDLVGCACTHPGLDEVGGGCLPSEEVVVVLQGPPASSRLSGSLSMLKDSRSQP